MRFPTALLLLTACGGPDAPEAPPVAGVSSPCALAGAAEFSNRCRVVRSTVDGRTLLTLNGDDGSFRRVEVGADGAGIVAADGAQPARVGRGPGGEIEIAIARDRYRLPAAAP